LREIVACIIETAWKIIGNKVGTSRVVGKKILGKIIEKALLWKSLDI